MSLTCCSLSDGVLNPDGHDGHVNLNVLVLMTARGVDWVDQGHSGKDIHRYQAMSTTDEGPGETRCYYGMMNTKDGLTEQAWSLRWVRKIDSPTSERLGVISLLRDKGDMYAERLLTRLPDVCSGT